MYIFLSVLILIASILLIIVVLIQKSKGGGLASSFAGANQVAGVRKTTNVVEKATWGLAIAICILSIASAFFIPSGLVKASRVIAPAAQEQTAATPIQTEQAAPAPVAPATETPAE